MDILEHWKNKEKTLMSHVAEFSQIQPPHYSTTAHCPSKTAFIKKKKKKKPVTKLSEKETVQSSSDHSYELLIRMPFQLLAMLRKGIWKLSIIFLLCRVLVYNLK